MRGVSAATTARRRRGGWRGRVRRFAWWIVVPAVAAGAVYGAAQLSHSSFGQSVLHSASNRLLGASAAIGLRVADIRVEGRQTTDRETILEALGAQPGTPILAVDPARAKRQLESLPWVRSALIERRLPDTLYVRLVEREPLALWQHAGRIELIDRTGAVIPVSRLDQFAKLPLIVGEDAASHASELLAMLASEPDLASRVTAAVQVGGRRWNLRIDNSISVLLPADDPAAAWADLAHLQRSSAILQRDVQAIDMRLPDRLVVRVTPEPPKEAPTAKKGRPSAKNT
jgi:cell division protein FtsQ